MAPINAADDSECDEDEEEAPISGASFDVNVNSVYST